MKYEIEIDATGEQLAEAIRKLRINFTMIHSDALDMALRKCKHGTYIRSGFCLECSGKPIMEPESYYAKGSVQRREIFCDGTIPTWEGFFSKKTKIAIDNVAREVYVENGYLKVK